MNRLAFVATGYIMDYDGISVYIENILKTLALHTKVTTGELAVDIFVSKSVEKFFRQRVLDENMDHLITIITVNDKNSLVKFFTLQYKFLLGKKYDVVFVPNPMPLFFSSGRRIKVIHDLTIKQTPELFSGKLHKYIDFLIWYMYRFDDAIGYISEQTKNDIARFYGIDNKKMLYVPNGIPFKVQSYPRPSAEKSLKKYEGKTIDFVVVGRINRSKGFDRILTFLKHFDSYLENQNYFEKVTLHIAGKQTDETKKILTDAQFEHIELIFYGYVDDETLNKLYQNSHFCFFLSRNEGYGLPLVEAMWFRSIPVISDIPIFHEIMGETYPKFGDISGYEDAISRFIVSLFENEEKRKEIFETLENIVLKEQAGYTRAVENLITYIENKEEI